MAARKGKGRAQKEKRGPAVSANSSSLSRARRITGKLLIVASCDDYFFLLGRLLVRSSRRREHLRKHPDRMRSRMQSDTPSTAAAHMMP